MKKLQFTSHFVRIHSIMRKQYIDRQRFRYVYKVSSWWEEVNLEGQKIILVIPSSKLAQAPLYLPGCDPSLTTVNVKVTGANQSPANGTRGPRVTRGGPMACPDGASGNINAHSFEEKEFKGRRNLVTCYLMKNVELIINVSGVVSTILWMCSVSMPQGAKTSAESARCCKHRPKTGPGLAHYYMVSSLAWN